MHVRLHQSAVGRFLASFVEKDEAKKTAFLKALPRVINSLPKRTLHKRVCGAVVAFDTETCRCCPC